MRDMRGGPDLFDVRENADESNTMLSILSRDFEDKGYLVISSECVGSGVTVSTTPGYALIRRGKVTEKGFLPIWNNSFLNSPDRQKVFLQVSDKLKIGSYHLAMSSAASVGDAVSQVVSLFGDVIRTAQTKVEAVSTETIKQLSVGDAESIAILTVQYKGPTVARAILSVSAQMAVDLPLAVATGVSVSHFGIRGRGQMCLYLIDVQSGRVLLSTIETPGEGGASLYMVLTRMLGNVKKHIPKAV